jgi:Zn ribbon nucleic-acid-binding protein
MRREYFMAEDCPQCGQKDEPDRWLGARMGSTMWGHNYSCCSDKCGHAYLTNPKRIERDKAAARERINELRRHAYALERELERTESPSEDSPR